MRKTSLVLTSCFFLACFDLGGPPFEICGNGVIEEGETCDFGFENGFFCNATCQFVDNMGFEAAQDVAPLIGPGITEMPYFAQMIFDEAPDTFTLASGDQEMAFFDISIEPIVQQPFDCVPIDASFAIALWQEGELLDTFVQEGPLEDCFAIRNITVETGKSVDVEIYGVSLTEDRRYIVSFTKKLPSNYP